MLTLGIWTEDVLLLFHSSLCDAMVRDYVHRASRSSRLWSAPKNLITIRPTTTIRSDTCAPGPSSSFVPCGLAAFAAREHYGTVWSVANARLDDRTRWS